LSALLDTIAPQVEQVVLVDNGSVDQQPWLRGIGDQRRLELLLLDRNVGVAAAHNLGIARARTLGADAVLLLDQDSVPAPDMVAELRKALLALQRNGESVAAVGPCHLDQRTGAQSPFVRFGFFANEHLLCGRRLEAGSGKREADANPENRTIECDHLITSGTLIPISSLDGVGGLDEGLFVDNVDTEWCFRAISKGYKVFGACSARMSHAVGDTLRETWVPYSDEVVIHSPIRLYYIVRNHLLLYGRGYTPARWTIQDAPRLMYKAMLFTTSISPRRKNLSMIVKGLWDGARGETGPYEHR
jgi:rhamnosyltransferase